MGVKAAAAFFVCITVASVMVVSVEAWRVEFFNFWVKLRDGHVELQLNGEGDAYGDLLNQLADRECYLPDYLPEGTVFSSAEIIERSLKIDFIGKNGQLISFEQYEESKAPFYVNTDNKTIEEVELKNGIGYCTQSRDTFTLIWNENEYSFMLFTTLGKEEAIRIANSMGVARD